MRREHNAEDKHAHKTASEHNNEPFVLEPTEYNIAGLYSQRPGRHWQPDRSVYATERADQAGRVQTRDSIEQQLYYARRRGRVQ